MEASLAVNIFYSILLFPQQNCERINSSVTILQINDVHAGIKYLLCLSDRCKHYREILKSELVPSGSLFHILSTLPSLSVLVLKYFTSLCPLRENRA